MMQHYFYFSLKANAEAAQTKLCEFEFSVEVRKSNAGTDWLVLATGIPPTTGDEMETLRNKFEHLARQFSGEYDGWEMAVKSTGPGDTDESSKFN